MPGVVELVVVEACEVAILYSMAILESASWFGCRRLGSRLPRMISFFGKGEAPKMTARLDMVSGGAHRTYNFVIKWSFRNVQKNAESKFAQPLHNGMLLESTWKPQI